MKAEYAINKNLFSTLNIVIVFLIFSQLSGFAQQSDIMSEIDSLLQTKSEEPIPVAQENAPTFESNIRTLRQYALDLNKFSPKLKFTLDTVEINEVITDAARRNGLIDQTIKMQGSQINLRYINALEDFLNNTNTQLQNIENQVNRRSEELLDLKNKLDSIKNDNVFNVQIPTVGIFYEYSELVDNLKSRLAYTDSVVNSQRFIVAGLQSRVSYELINSKNILESLVFEKQIMARNLFKKEDGYIWQSSKTFDQDSLWEIVSQSYSVNRFVINSYLKKHYQNLILLLLLFIGFFRWIQVVIRNIKTEKEFANLIFDRTNYIHKFPFLSPVLVLLAIGPFFFPDPPISFFTFMVFLTVSISGILLRKRFDSGLFRYWIGLYVLFFLSSISNLYWGVAFGEKWHLLLMSLIGSLIALALINRKRTGKSNYPEYVTNIFGIYIILQGVSIFSILLGRFSLGKMIGVTATISLLHIGSLIIFTLIIKEFIYLLIEVSKKTESGYTSFIDFKELERKINRVFSIIALVIWAYFFLDSLYILNSVLGSLFEFLEKPRVILNLTFSYSQIVVFFIAVYAAFFLANTVSYFLAMRDEQLADSRNKRFGSYILLIRLGILTLGFLIAVALTGISLDKITIVLGALTLGISFGLQNIVNNLVSGIILAFERPIQIGDTVQVGTMEGIVKEVGIRASKIQNWDGAEVIIPNGDMLAQHLINWTLSDKKRRVELIIGVSYNSDMDLVTKLIHEQLNEPEMLEHPPKRVFLQSFADNSVNFRVLFWVNDSSIWLNIRDKVMRNIFKSFKKNNVEIPFPQRDLHIKGFPGLLAEKLETVKDIIEEDSSRPKVEKEDQGKAKPD